MRILVTGGLGHIGSKLIRKYLEREEIELIRILDNISTQRYISLFDLPSDRKTKIEFVEGDITNGEIVKKAVKDIDIVIHLAAITDAISTLTNAQKTFKVNYGGTWNILWASINANVKRFLYASTTSVYGEAEGIVDENSPEKMYKPASPYAESKLEAEKLIQSVVKETGFPTIILRKGTIFGKSTGIRFHTAINKFCYLSAMGKPLEVWDSALNSKRPYLGLNDCINAYKFFETHGNPGEVYNVITDNFEMKEIIEIIKKYVPDVRIEIVKSPLLNQKPYHVSNEKVRRLGFEFRDDLQEHIKETINLFKAIRN